MKQQFLRLAPCFALLLITIQKILYACSPQKDINILPKNHILSLIPIEIVQVTITISSLL